MPQVSDYDLFWAVVNLRISKDGIVSGQVNIKNDFLTHMLYVDSCEWNWDMTKEHIVISLRPPFCALGQVIPWISWLGEFQVFNKTF